MSVKKYKIERHPTKRFTFQDLIHEFSWTRLSDADVARIFNLSKKQSIRPRGMHEVWTITRTT